MESDLQPQHQLHPHQMEPMGSGLMRYQSAPSSFFSSFLDSDDFFPRRPLSPETERIFARFMNSGTDTAPSHNLGEFQHNSPPPAEVQSEQELQIMGSIKTETVIHEHQNQPNNFYHSASQPPRPPIDYRVVNTAGGKDRLPPMKMESGGGPNNSNLVRQRSSPAGLFSNINIDNELASYAAMRGIGAGYVAGSNMETPFSSGSSRVPPSVAESEVKPMGGGLVGPEGGRAESYVTGYPWDDSALISNKMGGLKRSRDDEDGTGTQSGEVGSRRPPSLAHHLSLEKSSAEMAAIENFFQFQDSVPCKIRAKRGCATHPRSIAERVRRTKISERMRKLQELVPNMDKQTNTSDMLDLAVDYIKELQKEVEKLSDSRSKCTCPHKQQS